MGVHLGGATHPHVAATVVVFQQAVDPLRLAARLVALGFVRRKFALLPPSGVVVDQRHMTFLAGHLTDDPAAIGRVGQVI